METNITEQQYSDGNLALAEPHFDEEATVAAARPVVPLQQIATKARSKRLAFGLSIVVALMVGALGATLIYKQRAQDPATAIVDTAVAGFGASGDGTNPASMPEAKEGAAGQAAGEAVREDNAFVADQKPKPQVAARIGPAKARTVQEKPVSQADEKQMWRQERFEERRLRNKEEREARREGRRRRKSDDLLRIREIFEGSPRP